MDATRARRPASTTVAHPSATEAIPCSSSSRLSALDRLPPRTPGYADAQVPRRPSPATRHGAIAHYWFRIDGTDGDVAFGFREIEVAVTPDGPGKALVELYCVGDGFQTGHGMARGQAIPIVLRTGDQELARVAWNFPDVLDGHADPIAARWRIDLSADAVAALDTLAFAPAQAWVRMATDPLAR